MDGEEKKSQRAKWMHCVTHSWWNYLLRTLCSSFLLCLCRFHFVSGAFYLSFVVFVYVCISVYHGKSNSFRFIYSFIESFIFIFAWFFSCWLLLMAMGGFSFFILSVNSSGNAFFGSRYTSCGIQLTTFYRLLMKRTNNLDEEIKNTHT